MVGDVFVVVVEVAVEVPEFLGSRGLEGRRLYSSFMESREGVCAMVELGVQRSRCDSKDRLERTLAEDSSATK